MEMLSKKNPEAFGTKDLSAEEKAKYDRYKAEEYSSKYDGNIEMHDSAKMMTAVPNERRIDDNGGKVYFYGEEDLLRESGNYDGKYGTAVFDKQPSKKGDLSDLVKSLENVEKVEHQVFVDPSVKLTKDQLAKQEKELVQKFKENLITLERSGTSPEVLEKHTIKFEAYLEDLRAGKAIYTPIDGKIETGNRGKITTTSIGAGLATVITAENPIFETVVVDQQNTIGKIFLQIIRENPGAPLTTILTLVQQAMAQIAQTEVWRQEPELSNFILDEVVRTLAIAYILDYNLPRDIERLSENALSTYQGILTMLCNQIKDLHASFSATTLEAGTQQITEMLMHQLASVCCSGKQLKVVYDEMQERIDSILLKTRLFEFVKTHPGLEHKAGVRPGGTFVMVYLEGDEKSVSQASSFTDIKFLELPKVESVSEEEMILQLWEVEQQFTFRFINQKFANEMREELLKEDKAVYSMVVIQDDLASTVRGFASLLNKNFAIRGVLDKISAASKGNTLRLTFNNKTGIEGEGYFQCNNPAILGTIEPIEFKIERSIEELLNVKDRVIADFSLPYMCCSDCAPVNFVIPKDPPILRLPEKYVCLKDGEPVTPLPFSVSPEDGEIEAEVYGGIESGLTFDDEGKAFFDASLTDPSLHGKEIGFKVDGEATNCKIVVYAEPPLSVTSEVRYLDELKTAAEVTFTVSDIYPNLTHTWKDGLEGHVSNELPDANGKVSFTYTDLPVNDTNTINPTVTISNGFCEKVVEIGAITFDDPITEVKLEIQNTFCIDNANGQPTEIPFTLIEPEGLTIRFANEKFEGLTVADKTLLIDPSRFKKFYAPIEFTLGTLPTEASLTVFPSLFVNISQVQGEVVFRDDEYYQEYFFTSVFDDTVNTDGITMIWEVDGVEVGQGKELTHQFLIQEEPTTYKVSLKAAQEGGCATESVTEVTVENPEFKLTLPGNQTTYCLNDENAYPISIFPASEGVKLEGLGISHEEEKDQYFFTPSQTGLSEAGTVAVSIDGAVYLKLRVETIAVARFDVKIENGEVVVINTSDNADQYVFEVGNDVQTFTTKETYRRKVDLFDQQVIDVTLTTVTFCGKDIAKQVGISLETKLTLPVKHVCLKDGDEAKPLAFDVVPESAKVAANVDDNIKSGLFYDENRKPFFDPFMTDPKLYGKPIEFTLDGRLTDCAITVYPELPLSVNSSVSYNETKTEAQVTFRVSEVYSDVEYHWSDSLGNEATKTPDADGNISFFYTGLPVNESNTVDFFLKLTNGSCVTDIPMEPITFEEPILDFSLSIQDTFCMGDADNEFVKIPFTNIQPEGLTIGIEEEPVEGLRIEGTDLVIDLPSFKRFSETIRFTLGGNPTSAKITIYPAFEIAISSKDQGLKWENNQLMGTYLLNAVLPDGMSSAGLTFEWEIGGQIVSSASRVTRDFPVYQSPMGYEVRLRVLQEGACPIETSTILNVEYPEFFMSIENNRLDYCSNDSKAYTVSLNPPVNGVIIDGLGMSRIDAENRNVFTPDQTGLAAAGPVPLSFDGLTYLTLNITTVAEARFEVQIVNGDVIITNSSDPADAYIFTVNEEVFEYTTRRSIKRPVDSFQESFIDVTLKTISFCGEGYAEQLGIKIKDDNPDDNNPDPDNNTNCAGETLERINKDKNNLPSVADLNIQPEVEYLVVDQTQTQYDNAQIPGALDGGMFSDLPTFGILFSDAGLYIDKLRLDDKVRKVLSEYLVAQAKLFFNLLHCQPHEKLRAEEQNILELISGLLGVLSTLRTNQIQYDTNKELEDFLKSYIASTTVIDFIKEEIRSKLLPEVQASNNVL
jgi:hypothetical protein